MYLYGYRFGQSPHQHERHHQLRRDIPGHLVQCDRHLAGHQTVTQSMARRRVSPSGGSRLGVHA
jgi:hypothetical protein